MTSTLQNSQAIKEALETHEMENELKAKWELTNMETPELHRKLNITTKDDKIEDLYVGDFKVTKIKLNVTSKILRYTNDERLKFAKLLTEKGYKVILY